MKVYIDKRLLSELIDEMILQYKDDKEFMEALKFLDKSEYLGGDFYDKVIQLVFSVRGMKENSRIKEDRMKDFMKNLTRKDKNETT
tara:strand:+ start:1040 stop:1297 length:258 start_codon:yes stop_codon:yes gene_type:complete